MDRRRSGMAALLLAVFAAIVVPQVLRPGIAGQPTAAPLPAPPEIGTCVTLGSRSFTRVDCAEPHDGEVFVTWSADDPARPADRHSLACADEWDASLDPARATRVHGWEPTVFNVSTRLIRAPRQDRLGDRAWAACLIRPADQSRYEGTVGGGPVQAMHRPGVFGDCSSGSLYFQLPCTDPHTIERLGTAAGEVPLADAVDLQRNGVPAALDAVLRQNCLLLAAEMIGAPDPTSGGRLTFDVVRSSLVTPTPSTPQAVAWSVDCVMRTDGVELVDSVVGLGADPLPVG